MRKTIIVLSFFLLLCGEKAFSAVYTVNSNESYQDKNPGDGISSHASRNLHIINNRFGFMGVSSLGTWQNDDEYFGDRAIFLSNNQTGGNNNIIISIGYM